MECVFKKKTLIRIGHLSIHTLNQRKLVKSKGIKRDKHNSHDCSVENVKSEKTPIFSKNDKTVISIENLEFF